MNAAEAIQQAVDRRWRDEQSSGHRYHLGASVIGRSCMREVWYKFHWWHAVRHTGRMLRLFARGHREEQHVVADLRRIGAVVHDVDNLGQQARFSNLWGLFGGERDAQLSNLEEYGLAGSGLLEIKTYNEKQFKNLQNKGLLSAKPEHFIQMQMYMRWSGLAWGLYYAVCKNDDEVYCAVVPYRPEVADQYTERARRIITSSLPPKRISDDSTWYACRFCDFKRHCHDNAVPDKNCRTCQHVSLALDVDNEDGDHAWTCNKWQATIPAEYARAGCAAWEPRNVA